MEQQLALQVPAQARAFSAESSCRAAAMLQSRVMTKRVMHCISFGTLLKRSAVSALVWQRKHLWCARMMCLQVHGSAEAADAARAPPRWRQLLWLIYDALRRPLLWFFIAVGFLWGA
jgi:hypothetical protein